MPTDTFPTASSDLFGNPVTANLYGVPAFFSGDTPIDAIQAAFYAYARTLRQSQQPEQRIRSTRELYKIFGRLPGQPSEGEAAGTPPIFDTTGGPDIPGRPGEPSGGAGQLPGITPTSPGVPAAPAPGTLPYEGVPGGKPSPPSECGYLDIGCYLQQFVTSDVAKDIGKRIALLLFALVILVIAVISLR